MTTLTVGGLPVEEAQARTWAEEYLLPGPVASGYPAYDAYEGSGRDHLGNADLLAPALLNVHHNPVPTYYSLQAMLPALNAGLSKVPTDVTLEKADDGVIESVAALFGALDQKPAPPYVKMVTLAKVLSRKRPGLIPVWDTAVGYAYSECRGAPVPWEKGRSWAGYAAEWLRAMKKDLLRHHDTWSRLAEIAPDVPITPLRALDIVAWQAGLAAAPKKPRGRRAAPVDPI